MKHIKTYKQLLEGLIDKMLPVNDEEIKKFLSKLNALDRLKEIKKNNLDDKFKPSDEEIIKSLFELSVNFNNLSPLDKIDKIRRYELSEELIPSDEEIKKSIKKLDDKIIRTTYQIITPESAENGDYAEEGFEDEEGENMIPDDWEYEEKTVVEKAVDFITDSGYVSPSNHPFMIDTWYSTITPEENYESNEEKYYSYHLYGFTKEEQKEIYIRIKENIST